MVAGISWADKQYFAMEAAPLVAPFKRNMNEDVIIGECEPLVILVITLLWGKEDSSARILIVCTDNMNVFEWLSGWRAKAGCANRMLQALVDYLVEEGIEIIPRYVRSGRNFSCDFLSRANEGDIDEWSHRMGMTRRDLPKQWRKFSDKWMPQERLEQGDQIDIRRILREDGHGISACEWRPAAYTFVRACQQYQCETFLHEPDHYGLATQIGQVPYWNQHHVDILVGMAWADAELSDFAYSVAQICPTSAVAITPHAFRGPSLLMMHWKECIFVDSAKYGSAHNQIWRLYIWGQLDAKSLVLEPEYQSSFQLGHAYGASGFGCPQDDIGATRVIPLDCQSGLTVIVDSEEGQRYSVTSHIPILNLPEIWGGEPGGRRRRMGRK